MNEFIKPVSDLVKEYDSDLTNGLTERRVAENLIKYGANELFKKKPPSLISRILAALSEPMLILLIIAGLIAVGANLFRYLNGGTFDFLECVGIFIAVIISVLITIIMEGKSAKAFEALNKIGDDVSIKVIRDSKALILNQKDAVVGDVALISTGDRVPADGRLIESAGLLADESMLTGESFHIEKNAEAVISDPKTPLAERFNMLYSGTFITGGSGKFLITAVGEKTEFGKIAHELNKNSKASESSTPLQERLTRLSKKITLFGISAAALIFVIQLINFGRSGELNFEAIVEAFVSSIILIVAAVPEGLPAIVGISLSLNVIKLAKLQALVKKMLACETIGSVNVICSDKTGTLTENRMTAVNKLDEINDKSILKNICVNSDAELGEDGEFIGNPTECALLTAAGKANYDYRKVRGEAEFVMKIPFSSEEKMATAVILEADNGENNSVSYYKGSPGKIIKLCGLHDKDEIISEIAQIKKEIKKSQEKSHRVIAFAHSVNAGAPIFDGYCAIADPVRAEVYEAVNECYGAGVEVKMLTGDNIITATSIAEELGLLKDGKIAEEAKRLEELSDEELSERLKSVAVIARSSPSIKMRAVELLRKAGNVVAVTGDGINDAPALKNADVGIAMGITGTEVSKEAGDVVLLNDSFATIVRAIEWGRGIYENFKRFIAFQLTVNVSAVAVILVSVLMGLKEPFTALQLLWLNIIMDGPPALTLGLEPPYKNLMKRAPVKRSEDIISRSLVFRIGLTAFYMAGIFLAQYGFNFLNVPEEQTSTVLFAMFSLFQIFNSFNCRALDEQSIFKTFFKNKIMLSAVSATFILQILIIQFAGDFFKVVPLTLETWLKTIGISASVILVSEIFKLFLKIFKKNKTSVKI